MVEDDVETYWEIVLAKEDNLEAMADKEKYCDVNLVNPTILIAKALIENCCSINLNIFAILAVIIFKLND